MNLSPIGKIVAYEWKKTEEFRNSIKLDYWTIMPNHIHGNFNPFFYFHTLPIFLPL